MLFFGDFLGSGGIWSYLTLGLQIILVVLLAVFLIKKTRRASTKYKLSQFLEKKGIPAEIPVEEKRVMREPEGVLYELSPRSPPSEEEVRAMGKKLTAVLERERLLEQKDRTLTREIERLHQIIKGIGTGGAQAKPVEQRPRDESPSDGGLSDDTKKVLLIVDNLLENLPEEVITKFTNSEDFKLYQKVIGRAKK